MKKHTKIFLSFALLFCISFAWGGGYKTLAATDGLTENFNYSDSGIGTPGGSNPYNIYSVATMTTQLAQIDGFDTLKISSQPNALASVVGKVAIRDNASASSLFNQVGSSLVIKTRFKMTQQNDKIIQLYFGTNEVNSSGRTYQLLRMRYDGTRYKMGIATEVSMSSFVVSKNEWHEATFVLYENGGEGQDMIYTYLDDQLVYHTNFEATDNFDGKLTELAFSWNKGNYSSAEDMYVDYVSFTTYNKGTSSISSTIKDVMAGDLFEIVPPTLTEGASLPNYKVVISDPTKIEYNASMMKFQALAPSTTPVEIKFDYLDELIEDRVVSVNISEANKDILVTSIEQKLFTDDIVISKDESFDLNHLFKASPSTATNANLEYVVITGAEFIKIESNRLVGVASGIASIKASSVDGSNVSKMVNVKVVNGNYTSLNNYQLTDNWSDTNQTFNGFISQSFNGYTWTNTTVVSDEVFGKALCISGNGTVNSSGGHIDKYIPASELRANKDYKLTGWIKVNPEAATKGSIASVDIKMFAYYVDEQGKFGFGALDTAYACKKQNAKTSLTDGWVYIETDVINLDVNAIGKGFEGIKVEFDLWKAEKQVDAYFTHFSLVEQESVKTVSWDILNESGNKIDLTNKISLPVNTSFKIQVCPIPSSGSVIATFASSDESIANVDTLGVVTTLNKGGEVKITITVGNNQKELIFSVVKPVDSISIGKDKIEIILDKFDPTTNYPLMILPEGYTSELNLTIYDQTVCQAEIINESLWIKNPQIGTTTIQIQANDNTNSKLEILVVVRNYTISYDVKNVGNPLEEVKNVTTLPAELPILTAEGYVFEGWYLDSNYQNKAIGGTIITADITLYAKWEEKQADKFSIIYNIQNHGTSIPPMINVNTLPIELPILTAEGYVFEGWYLDADYQNKAIGGTIITADTTLYAKWIEKVYKIVFDLQGHGVAVSTIENVNTLPTELPTLTAEGYVFEGWYLDSNYQNKAIGGTIITADTTLYAKWTQIVVTFTITFVVNGHGVAPESINNVTALPTELPTLTAEGYIFVGWYFDVLCTQKAESGKEISSDTTLYAKWKPVEVTSEKEGLGFGIIVVVASAIILASGLGIFLFKIKHKKEIKE